ncbi:MAG TPA: hypothetical protein VFV85_06120 [Conexibacter sp.]|nr:hypothetical protein [Conexibacter sp.]
MAAAVADRNLLIATWNLRELGQLARTWAQPPDGRPARDPHAVAASATGRARSSETSTR